MSISFERLKLHWTCLENGVEGGHGETEEFLRVREFWLSVRGGGASKRNSIGHNGDVSPAPLTKKPRKASASYERGGLVGDEIRPSDDDDDDDFSEDEEALLGGEDADGLPRSTQYDLQNLDVSGSKACRTLEEVNGQWENRFRLYDLRVRAYKLDQAKKLSRLKKENESLKVENSELETRCSALQLRCESLRQGRGRSGRSVLNERDENRLDPVPQDGSAEREACREEQRRLEEENESLMAANAALQTQCDEAIRAQRRFEKIAGNHKADADEIQEQLDASRERARRLLDEIATLRAALQEEEKTVQQMRRDMRNESSDSQQGKVVQGLQQIVSQMQEMQARQQEEEASLRQDKSRMTKEIESLKDKLRDCQFHYDKSKAEVDRLQLEFGTNASQPYKLEPAHLDLQQTLAESTLQLETAEKELTAVTAQLHAVQAELETWPIMMPRTPKSMA